MRARHRIPARRHPVPQQFRHAAHAPRIRGLARARAQAPPSAAVAPRSGRPADPAGAARRPRRPRCPHRGRAAHRAARRGSGGLIGDETVLRVAFALLLAIAARESALAQSADARWPEKPIRMIVPLPAGAAVDIVARLICQNLGERLGQIIVVENRAGASGALAAEAVAKAAPDGYTLGMATTTTHVTTAILNARLPYDPVKSFVPVALIGTVPYVLTVSPKLPAKSVSELLALARAMPGTLSYSSVGN